MDGEAGRVDHVQPLHASEGEGGEEVDMEEIKRKRRDLGPVDAMPFRACVRLNENTGKSRENVEGQKGRRMERPG